MKVRNVSSTDEFNNVITKKWKFELSPPKTISFSSNSQRAFSSGSSPHRALSFTSELSSYSTESESEKFGKPIKVHHDN